VRAASQAQADVVDPARTERAVANRRDPSRVHGLEAAGWPDAQPMGADMGFDLQPKIRWKTAGAAALAGLAVIMLAGCGKPAPANAPANTATPANTAAATPGGPSSGGGGLIGPPGQSGGPNAGGGLGPGMAGPGGGPSNGGGGMASGNGGGGNAGGGGGNGGGGGGANHYDAIAVDDDVGSRGGDAGYGVGQGPTEDVAQQGAMAACKKAGNSNCEVKLTYTACGAYASSRTRYGTGEGSTEGEARSAAIANCGNAGCQLTVSDCVGQ
jgi:hypothetical protein